MSGITLTCDYYFNSAYVLLVLLCALADIYLIYKAFKKEKQIKHEINNKTYSQISILILRMTVANLLLSIVFNVWQIKDMVDGFKEKASLLGITYIHFF